MTLSTAKQKRLTSWQTFEQWQKKLFKTCGYSPSPEQAVFHAGQERIKLVGGGERGGKSFSTAMDALPRSFFTVDRKPGNYWIVGPDYRQTRPEFEYLLDAYKNKLGLSVEASMPSDTASPWLMRVGEGITWETRSSSNVMALASFAVDGVIMAEAAQQDYEVFLKLRGRAMERRAWMVLVGTFENAMRWYSDCFERWKGANRERAKSYSIPTWSNRAIFPGGRQDPEILAAEATFPPDLFLERFGGQPAKLFGLVFKEFDTAIHVQELEVEPELPVELAIDPGYTGAYAVLAIQRLGSFLNVIDEVYLRYGDVHEVVDICKRKPWWKLVPKANAGDGERQGSGGVIDIAGSQHHGMPSHVEIWRTEGNISLRYKPVPVTEGILVVRNLLKDYKNGGRPRIALAAHLSAAKDHEGHPVGILGEFDMYKYGERSDRQNSTDMPIDKYNHALKALGYFEYDFHGPVGGREAVVVATTKRKYWQ